MISNDDFSRIKVPFNKRYLKSHPKKYNFILRGIFLQISLERIPLKLKEKYFKHKRSNILKEYLIRRIILYLEYFLLGFRKILLKLFCKRILNE